MADLKLNRILAKVEAIEEIDEYRINRKKYSNRDELARCFHIMSDNLYYMHEFGIITNFEYREKSEELDNWFLNYDLSL